QTAALALSSLTSPAEVTQKLVGPNAQPVVNIPLPGWVWNLERRKQWQDALNQWRKIDNVVILVELPPATTPEAVLLGENVPQVIWLSRSGKADAAETRAQLEMLRHARCNLVGTVLNHAPDHAVKKRFARWVSCVALCSALAPWAANAQETNEYDALIRAMRATVAANEAAAAPKKSATTPKQPLTRPSDTLSPSDGDRAGVTG